MLVDGATVQPLPPSAQDEVQLLTPSRMSFLEQKRRELEEYQAVFDQNMRNKPVKHDKVFVFMWTWSEDLDDLNVKNEVWVACSCILDLR